MSEFTKECLKNYGLDCFSDKQCGQDFDKALELLEKAEQQRDDLLAACKVGLSYINAIVCKVPRPILELQEDKELVEAAIKKAQ